MIPLPRGRLQPRPVAWWVRCEPEAGIPWRRWKRAATWVWKRAQTARCWRLAGRRRGAMKAVPVLVASNVVALGLIFYLFVRQEDLEGRVASLQAGAPASEARRIGAGGPSASLPVSRVAEPESLAGMEPEEMEVFRKRVRRARELNSEEDLLRRFVERIDFLVAEGRVAPLSDEHKLEAARTLMGTRNAIPEILRERREAGDLTGMSSEERRELIRAEYERLRIEAQRVLEGLLPAEDARTIIADAFHDAPGQSDP